MFLGTGGSKGAGDSEENGFLGFSEIRDGGGLEFTGGIEVGKSGVGESVTDGNGGRDFGEGGEIESKGVFGGIEFERKGREGRRG
ncbi:hypothetical protein AgCh_036371 [Apium graveolens]